MDISRETTDTGSDITTVASAETAEATLAVQVDRAIAMYGTYDSVDGGTILDFFSIPDDRAPLQFG